MAYQRKKEAVPASSPAPLKALGPQQPVRAPPSVLALRDRILMLVNKVLSAVRRFRRKYTDKADDDLSEVYDEFLKPVLQRMSSKDDLKDWRDMSAVVIGKFKDDPNVSKRQDYKSLVMVCERAEAMSALLAEARPLLSKAFSYASKYLVSLAQVAGRRRFACIDEYENKLNGFRRDVDADLESVAKLTQELEAVRPISRYLNEYSKVLHFMRELLERMTRCAGALQRWTAADEEYVTKGEKECRQRQDESASLKARARSGMAAWHYDVEHGPARRAGDLWRANLVLAANREELVTLRKRQRALLRDQSAAPASAHGSVRAGVGDDGCGDGLLRWKSAPPSEYGNVVPTAAVTRGDGHADGRGGWDTERRAVHDAVDAAAHRVHASEEQLKLRQASAERFNEKVARKSRELRDASENAQKAAYMADSLKHLLSLKKSDMTLKKIEHNVFHIDGGRTDKAIGRAAQAVGSSWPKLYSQLTFTPSRSEQCLANDVQVIQRVGERWGQTAEEMAERALKKWVRKSCTASSNELGYTVQRMLRRSADGAEIRVVS